MKGFLNINKPIGFSSAKVVAIVKKKLGLSKKDKIGHMGTLDPLASGVLPIAIGRATRLFDLLLSKTKQYIAEFTFGYETDTLDSEGEVIEYSDNLPTKSQILEALPSFLGTIEQIPPLYSAKSVNGIRAYDLARKGEKVDLKKCSVNIIEYKLLEQINEKSFKFIITCGSGTYIRSLCRDLAHKLNSKATMTALCRIKSDVFNLDNAIDIENISEKDILPIDIVLQNFDKIEVDEEIYKDFLNGKKVNIEKNGIFRAYKNSELIGICEVNDNLAKMKIWL